MDEDKAMFWEHSELLIFTLVLKDFCIRSFIDAVTDNIVYSLELLNTSNIVYSLKLVHTTSTEI